MRDRFSRIVLFGIFLLVAAYVAEPYVARWLTPSTPRMVEMRGSLAEFEKTTIAIFDRVSPSVVQVAGRSDRAGGGEGLQSGTGFLWDNAGHIVTNEHVVQGASGIMVRLASGDTIEAEVVGEAPAYDLAVLQIPARALPEPIPVGTSADLKVGQSAFAIGNPFGLDQSLTVGVISALKRRLPTSAGREVTDVIQTDTAINPGNSGGPLLDSAGRLIGVNTAIFSPSGANAGVGFAIPVDAVNRVVPELIRNGRMPTPGIGIIAADEAVSAEIGAEGVTIVETVPGSPAERAGLRGIDRATGTVGDIIVAANGKPVRRLADLTDELEAAGIGNTVELSISRDGGTVPVRIEVADVSRRT